MIPLTKRVLLLVLCAVLALSCACGRAGESVATGSSASPTVSPEQETVISRDFQLEELPDIGAYHAEKADCFYDAPLREFKPSDSYGTLIPYQLGNPDGTAGEFGKYGFMTADGRIVTGGIYNSVYEYDLNGKTVFRAAKKVLNEHPETIPDWETDEEGASAAWQRMEDYYYDSVSVQLISSDGKRCLTTCSGPDCFCDPYSGVSLICCAEYRDNNDIVPNGVERWLLYDADLEPVADLTAFLRGYDDARIVSADRDSYVILGERYPEPEFSVSYNLLFFEDGKLDHVFEMGTEYPSEVCGDFVVSMSHVYDRNGNTLYTIGENDSTYTFYDSRNECVYTCLSDRWQLLRIDSKGGVTAADGVLDAEDYYSYSFCTVNDGTYLVVSMWYDYDYIERLLVFDSDLRLIRAFGEDADKLAFCNDIDNSSPDAVFAAKDGQTDIFDLNSQKTASVPFVFEKTMTNYGSFGSDQIYLYGEDGQAAVYSASDRSVRIVSMEEAAPEYPDYFSNKLLVYSEDVGGESDYRFRYVIQDIESGNRLTDNITAFHVFCVNGKTYFNYVRNDTVFVCDKELNVIASLYDDLYV